MGKFIDLTGERFGRLIVVARAENKKKRTAWLCRCDCGDEKAIRADDLKRGKTVSCGCFHDESARAVNTTHGLRKDPLYDVLVKMKDRCYNQNANQYCDYGGRGISVCDEWMGENGFVNFYRWAVSHGYERGLCIDRINNDAGYSKNNCRFVTHRENNNNRRPRSCFRKVR